MQCVICNETKTTNDFTKNYNECKDCRKIISKRYQQKNLDNKRFYCAKCDFNGATNASLTKHLKTKKHLA